MQGNRIHKHHINNPKCEGLTTSITQKDRLLPHVPPKHAMLQAYLVYFSRLPRGLEFSYETLSYIHQRARTHAKVDQAFGLAISKVTVFIL